MKRRMMLFLTYLFLGIGLVAAQTRSVTGVVTSADDGSPVVGASVLVKGTTLGTITDIDGKFQLNNVPASAKTIQVSFVGMKTQEVPVAARITVKLQSDTELLDEVVVTAMGISREKKALGYAVQDVKADQLTQGGNSSLSGALQGKLSGVDITPSSGMPGASSQITIRGVRSFTGNNTPLYIVDGMPVNSTADINTDVQNNGSVRGADFANRAVDIDPNDIASINILKGQAASALYGIRASNGVVIITTKSGKGLAKGKPQISFSSNASADIISRLPEKQMTYAQGTWDSKTKSLIYNPTASTSWGPKISDLPNSPIYGGNVNNEYTKNGQELHKGQYYVPQRKAAGLDPWTTPQAYDNYKDFFRTGVTWSNSLNVAQALDKTSYSISLGNSHQEGIIRSTGMDRYNVKATAETKFDEHWSSGFSANYITSDIKKAATSGNGLLRVANSAPPSYDLAGIPFHNEGDPYTQNSFRKNFDNSYWQLEHNHFTEGTHRFFGNAFVDFNTNFGTDNHKLDIKYLFGADAYSTHYEDSYGYGSYTGSGTGQIENYGITNVTYNSLLTANYDWKINSDWDLNAVLGNELVQSYYRQFHETGKNYNFSGWNHINNATTQYTSFNRGQNRTLGFFASVSSSYKNMLYLTVTGRQDRVSNMPRNNRTFFYPSASVGFIFTELEALKNNVLTYGKLRASYAEVGQAGDYMHNIFVTPSYGGGFYSFAPITYPLKSVNAYIPYPRIYDPALKPQNTKSYEFGIDLSFFNNLVSLSYTYARQNVKDQIFSIPLAGSTGAQEMLTNGGRIHTNSHELSLNINPIRQKNLDWNIGLNWTKLDNYVDELAPGVESITLGGYVTPQVRASIGEKFPTVFGSSYKRDGNGKIIVDEDGMPQVGENKVIGRISPDFLLNGTTSLRVYDFTLNAVFAWKSGGQMYSRTTALADFYGISKRTEDREGSFIVDGVKADGSKNDIAISGVNAHRLYYTAINNIDESAIYDNSFVKLREISLSYQILKKKPIDLSINVFARNLLLWTNMPDIDPESSQGNNNMAGAFEDYSMPQTKSFGMGLNIKF